MLVTLCFPFYLPAVYPVYTSSGRPSGSMAAPGMPPAGVGPGRPVADGVNGLSHAKHAFACGEGETERASAAYLRPWSRFVHIFSSFLSCVSRHTKMHGGVCCSCTSLH